MRLTRSMAVGLVLTIGAATTAAGQPRVDAPFWGISGDSVVAWHDVVDSTVPAKPVFTFEGVSTLGIGRDTQVIVRPWARHTPTGEWRNSLLQLSLRHQIVARRVSVRFEGGLAPSMVGLGVQEYGTALNPTVQFSQPYVTTVPALGKKSPPARLISWGYPLSAQVAASTRHVDVRVGVLDASPARPRFTFLVGNPKRSPQLAWGAGVTPKVGLRFGVSAAHGAFAFGKEFGEAPEAVFDADVRNAEVEYAFRHTRLMGEVVRTTFDTPTGVVDARGWIVSGAQTLAPRWVVAHRTSRVRSPQWRPTGFVELSNLATETTLAYRLTREMTVRAGHFGVRRYGQTVFDHQAELQMVWARRWW
ncbi:MAG: hypothetical protein U0Q12_23020 [Vicinamibacterales bacterium]